MKNYGIKKLKHKHIALLFAMALAGCGGGGSDAIAENTASTPSITPVIDLKDGPEQSYISDSAAIISVTLRAADAKQLSMIGAASSDQALQVFGKEIINQSANESNIVFKELIDDNSCIANKSLNAGESCTDRWEASTNQKEDAFEGKIVYKTNLGNYEAPVKIEFKSAEDPEQVDQGNYSISNITPMGTGLTSTITLANSTKESVNNPQIIFPDVIKDHINNINSLTEVQSGKSETVSFEIDDTPEALVALKQWQIDLDANKSEALIQYKSATFPLKIYELKPVIYTKSIEFATPRVEDFIEVDDKYEASFSILNISGSDVESIDWLISPSNSNIEIDDSNCAFPLTHNQSCHVTVKIDPSIANNSGALQAFNITPQVANIANRDDNSVALQIGNLAAVSMVNGSTLIENYQNQIELTNSSLLHWLPSTNLADYAIIDEQGVDVSERFEISGGIKTPSCLSTNVIKKSESCYLTVKPTADETGQNFYLQLKNSNVNQDKVQLPSFTQDGIQEETSLHPSDVVQGKDLVLYFTIAPPVAKTYNGFELAGLSEIIDDNTIIQHCSIGNSIDAENPCYLKLAVPASQIQGGVFSPELIIKWQDDTQTKVSVNPINVVDVNDETADKSGLANLDQLNQQMNYLDINDDGLHLYLKNTTGKVLSGLRVNVIASWLEALIDTSELSQPKVMAVDEALIINLPIKADKEKSELYTELQTHLSDLLRNEIDGNIVEIIADHALNSYLPTTQVDIFPYMQNEDTVQSFNEEIIFHKPGKQAIIVTNPTQHAFSVSFDDFYLPNGVTYVTEGAYEAYANCTDGASLAAGMSCALVFDASVSANENALVDNKFEITLTPEDAEIPATKLTAYFQIKYVNDVVLMPSDTAITIPLQGVRKYDLKLKNNEPSMQWVPAKNVEDYVLIHENGTDGMRIVEPVLTPSCLTGSPIASSDYCYIGLEVADNAQVAPDYQLSLNKGDGNLAKDNLDVGIIPIAEQGRAVLSLQQNQKTITSIYAGESFEVVVAPEEGWQDKVSQDQTFTVSINDAQITFPNGNQCVLSIDDPNAPCRILASTPVDLASNFYQIDVSSDNEIVLSAQQITFFTAIKPKAKNLSTGAYYACSLDSSMPYCWGNNNTGQLGTDLVTKSSIPVAVSQGEIPEGVELKEIAADSNKACVLSAEGKAYCWGSNYKGNLGNGTTTNSPTPVAVSQGEIPVDVNLVKISDSCALGDNAKVYCWGDNTYGGLGTDMVSGYSTTPAAIAQGDIPDGVGVIELSSHCILTDNAKAYCWGRNNEGQLGDGTKVDSFRPAEVKQGEIPLGTYLSAIDGTGYHKCGIATNGKAYCWGKNYRGQLGNNTQVDSLTPVEVSQGAIPDGVQLTDISVGYEHACVLGNDSKAYCWGAGYHGRLGDGATSIRSVPVAVSQGEIPTDVKLTSISVGASESCALGDDGNKYCWGYNYYGQLGNGTEINSSVPVKVLPAAN